MFKSIRRALGGNPAPTQAPPVKPAPAPRPDVHVPQARQTVAIDSAPKTTAAAVASTGVSSKAVGSASSTSHQSKGRAKTTHPIQLTPHFDQSLQRHIVEFNDQQTVYRIPAHIGAAGRYEITGVLSSGGFGIIYQGRDRRLFGKQVLVKAIRYNRRHLKVANNRAVLKEVDEQRARLRHECKMLLAGYRRGIAGMPILLDLVTDLGLDLYGPHRDETGGQHFYTLEDKWREEPYLVLSFVDGAPMHKAVNEPYFTNNRLGNTKQVILQVGRMLAAFHCTEARKGKQVSFIYQDLKPENIIFSREKQPILIDFGGFAVRVNDQTNPKFARTGTPGYQPPEFLDGTPVDRLDARADVFSLGMTVYHLLGGLAPKADQQGRAIQDPAVSQTFPKPWQDWIAKATQADREQRFASIDQAIEQAHDLPLRGMT